MKQYLESADVGRQAGLVTASVRAAVASGRLRVAATTLRGTRLFDPKEVEQFLRARRENGAVRFASSRTARSERAKAEA